jgi:hypothetical protein
VTSLDSEAQIPAGLHRTKEFTQILDL